MDEEEGNRGARQYILILFVGALVVVVVSVLSGERVSLVFVQVMKKFVVVVVEIAVRGG